MEGKEEERSGCKRKKGGAKREERGEELSREEEKGVQREGEIGGGEEDYAESRYPGHHFPLAHGHRSI
jgi:hypothetical protein